MNKLQIASCIAVILATLPAFGGSRASNTPPLIAIKNAQLDLPLSKINLLPLMLPDFRISGLPTDVNDDCCRLQLENVRMVLFNRLATVSALSLISDSAHQRGHVSAVVLIPSVGGNILVKVDGDALWPDIHITSSNVQLQQHDALALLLFNLPFDQIDSAQIGYVGALSNALTDNAVPLHALFILAMHPLQSITYDPIQKRLSVQILRKIVPLPVLWNKQAQQSPNGKSVFGGGLRINPALLAPGQTPGGMGTTLLEWNRRY